MTDIPIIDVSPLRSDILAERMAVAAQLHEACRDTGFFYAAGHGMDPALIEQAFAGSRLFFAQTAEAKRALDLKRSPANYGYGELGSEQLQPDRPPDVNESFNIGLELPPGDPALADPGSGYGPNLWPDLPGWREQMLGYFDACLDLGRLIHRGFCLDLGLPEDFFADKLDRTLAVLRLLHYPASHGKTAPRQFGAGEHTDYGNLTLLTVNGVAGLQLRKRSGEWVDAPHVPGTFICNIGDCLMRWTNDIYVSTPHRVLPPADERYSIAFFLDPNADADVRTIEGFGESKYPPIRAGDYIKQRFDETYPHRGEAAA
ncbi:MAG TPA: 2-oxoglutarate and iron-dependent oxygenase domain-containing protein [Caulobacteraceae bacterium]|nr:2-oxoglutarate and iron-dependent oxygenase domain-containing protein [Caulobacteraceae bacterium]